MRSYEEHLAAIRGALPAPTVVTRSLLEVNGLILARTIAAAYDMPRFNNSQMDGYAITTTEGGTFTVGQTVAAGAMPSAAQDGIATPIMTGAKVPEDTVTIVPVEQCEPPQFPREGEKVTIPAAPAGQFIREAGSDIAAGKVLVEEGTRLNPAIIGTLASQGITEVEVYAPARIVVATGGAEIGGQGTASIPDANAPMIAALCREYGIEVVSFVRTNDDPGILRSDLEGVVRVYQPDAIVTSGGVSHGKFEVVRQVFEEDGWFGHVAQQPGGPQGLSKLSSVPVICLPGNPVSTLVSFRIYVGPTLGRARAAHTAQVTVPVTGLEGRDQFRRGIIDYENGIATAELFAGTGSHLISQAMNANALIRIPAGAQLQPGDVVEVIPF